MYSAKNMKDTYYISCTEGTGFLSVVWVNICFWMLMNILCLIFRLSNVQFTFPYKFSDRNKQLLRFKLHVTRYE